jgi:hypothetical protein
LRSIARLSGAGSPSRVARSSGAPGRHGDGGGTASGFAEVRMKPVDADCTSASRRAV